MGSAGTPRPTLHLFQCLDPQDFETFLEHAGGKIGKYQSRRPYGWLRLENRTRLVERREMSRQFVQVVAKKVRPVFLGDRFQNNSEIQKMFRQGQLGRLRQRDGAVNFADFALAEDATDAGVS